MALWHVADPTRPRRLVVLPMGMGEVASSLVFSGDGRVLVASTDHLVYAWNVIDPAGPRPLGAPFDPGVSYLDSVAVDARASLLALVGDGTITLWDVRDPDRRTRLGETGGAADRSSGIAQKAQLTADGTTLLSNDQNEGVTLWDVSDPTRPSRVSGPLTVTDPSQLGEDRIFPMALSSATLAVGGENGMVGFWDISDERQPRSLGSAVVGDLGTMWSLAFASDGRTLAVRSGDRTLSLWDTTVPSAAVALGSPVSRSEGAVVDLVYAAAPRNELATITDRGVVTIWDMTELGDLRSDPLGYSCRITRGALGEGDWAATVSTDLPYFDACS